MNKTTIFLGIGAVIIVILTALLIFVPNSKKSVKKTPTGMANPASVNCEQKGGSTIIAKKPDGGEYGICDFGDNKQCEEWALMRGDCPVGGVKITGYDTQAQIYCVITGGQTLALGNATCTLKDGTVCPANDYLRGSCPSSNLD